MNYRSFADLGGGEDHRPVTPESDAVHFQADWEPRALALTVAMGATGLWNLDQTRAARETLRDYPALSYYQIWITALEQLVQASGILEKPAPNPPRMLQADQVAAVLARGAPTVREARSAARFRIGERVRTLQGEMPHHTRLPAYARGKSGTVQRVHGVHVFADSNAQGLGEAPQWLYTVVFTARELWGPAASAKDLVSVDAWEPYLSPASRA